MKNILIILLSLLPFVFFAQITDDFEDGNLNGWTESTVGHWAASNTSAINGTYSLKHNLSNVDGESYISHDMSSVSISSGDIVWRFNLKNGNWDPSGSNLFGVYLFSDNSDLTAGLNGYVIGVDMTGTSDFLTLWKVTAGSITTLIQTTFDWSENDILGIQVRRSATGVWNIEYDENGGFDNLISGGTETDNSHTNALFTGLYFKFTSTRAGLLWFDDFTVSEDTEAPEIVDVSAVSNNRLLINFNETLSESSAETVLNYSVDGGIGNPLSATLNASDNKQVELVFAGSFTENLLYQISVNGVADLSGNVALNITQDFTYQRFKAETVTPVSIHEADVYFNKDVEITTAQNVLNYTVNNGIGNPQSAVVDAVSKNVVHLNFSNNFQLEQIYTMTIENIQDLYGNTVQSVNLEFSYYEPQAYDLVINEIMCDVNPAPEALPIYEYVELYNHSNFDINLTGWTFKIGDNTERDFPATLIPSGSYAIICEAVAVSEFNPYGITLGILNASELTTTGKRLVIRNSEGVIIEDVTYSIDWYHDEDKDGGGWSMERIDPLNFCSEETNWTATVDYTGGTPGRMNSVMASNPDNSSPELVNISLISSKHVQIIFSEKLNVSIAETIENYILNGSINPVSAVINSETNAIVELYFADNFNIGNNSILIKNIQDNCGNVLAETIMNFNYELIHLKSIEVMSSNQLRIRFSEKLDEISAQTLLNYSANKGIGTPSIAIISNSDSSIVNLQFDNSFIEEEIYTLTVQNVKDVNDNTMNLSETEFVYYIPKPFDIIINEIMCDINPVPLVVPAARYVELYNTSNFDLDLTDWIFLSEDQTERIFPYLTLESGSYLLLCEEGQEHLFTSYGSVLPILTSSDIITSGRNLKLMKPDRTIIEELSYSDTWYDDTEKDNGGWSLERIDPLNFCGENNNWTACINEDGGTPGHINSVKKSNIDNSAPVLSDVKIISSDYIQLIFNEFINQESGSLTANYTIDNSIGNPLNAFTDESERNIVHLFFANQFSDKQTYNLTIDNLSDNCENTIQITGFQFTYFRIFPTDLWVRDEKRIKIKFSEAVEFTSGTNVLNYSADNGIGNPEIVSRETADTSVVHIQFSEPFPQAIPVKLSLSGIKDLNSNVIRDTVLTFTYYTPVQNDIALNEVLFYPNTGGNDFVELYNRSGQTIDLVNLRLAVRDDENPDSIISITPLSVTNKNFDPDSYMAFTSNKDGVLEFYMSKNQENIIELSSFPTYPSDFGTVVLLYKDTLIIDEFSYNEDMHFKLLDNVQGVSLERVNYNLPTQDASNWHSASEMVGFATPAYENSQYNETDTPPDVPISVSPYMFSPDNDGIDDYAEINYTFEQAGYVADIIIFDAKGRQVRHLAGNLLLSVQGKISWDGLYDNYKLAPAGTYLIYFKVFNLDGNEKMYKIPVVSARRL